MDSNFFLKTIIFGFYTFFGPLSHFRALLFDFVQMEEKIEEYELLNRKGLNYLNSNQPGKAIESFDMAIKLNDKNASYWNNKGEIHIF